MSIDRRASTELRRRRVLYQTNRDTAPETAADRRAAQRLREARRPTANYGSHVNRRLRGRWFSLVPVHPMTMAVCSGVVIGVATLLILMHWLAVTWAPVASSVELARPLRLDRPDSFGGWARTFYLAAGSATALLVYQLRRYKIDDYKGHYRIWRPVIILLGVMSIDSVVDIVPWLGAMIDATLGKRVALTGADWIRIVLTVGGGALSLRLLAEVRRSRFSLAMMAFALLAFAVPLTARWNLLDATTVRGWMMVTSAPIMASAAMWVSIAAYLRMLLREVRRLDDVHVEPVAVVKLSSQKQGDAPESVAAGRGWRFWQRGDRNQDAGANEKPAKPVKKSRLADLTSAATSSNGSNETRATEGRGGDTSTAPAPSRAATSSRTPEPQSVGKDSPDAKPAKKGLLARLKLGSRRAKTKDAAEDAPVQPLANQPKRAQKVVETDSATQESDPVVKRRWFGLRGAKVTKAEGTEHPDSSGASTVKSAKPAAAASRPAPKNEAKSESESPESEKKAKRGWFSFGRKPATGVDAPASAAGSSGKPAGPPPANQGQRVPAQDPSDQDDDEDGDLSHLPKSERRRLRKEMRRGRAA